MNRLNRGILVMLFATFSLVGCGGGSSAIGTTTPSTGTLSGTAAVGAPIVGGTVAITCASGPAPSGGSTSSTGGWSATLATQTLPCGVQVSGGSINGAANSQTYQSIAYALGTVNITPLTSLIVANLTGSTSPLVQSQLAALNPAAVSTALSNVTNALGATMLGSNHPITTAFTPASGNVMDDVLSAMASAISNIGLSFSNLMAQASAVAGSSFTPSGLSAALASAYGSTASGLAGAGAGAGTGGTTVSTASASGNLVVVGGRAQSFAPQTDGFTVKVTATEAVYRFFNDNTITNGGVTTKSTEYVEVALDVLGRVSGVVYGDKVSPLRAGVTCSAGCAGLVVVERPAGASHPVTVRFNRAVLSDGSTLEGALVGDTPNALWVSRDLPRTTDGFVSVDGVNFEVVAAKVATTTAAGSTSREVTLTLIDGARVTVNTYSDGRSPTVSRQLGADVGLCLSACPVTLTPSGSILVLDLRGTTLSNGKVLRNQIAINTTQGSLSTASLGNFTPNSDDISSQGDVRSYAFNADLPFGSSGITSVGVSFRNGTLASASLTTSAGVVLSCFESAAAAIFGTPTCAGITLGADRRTLTFTAAVLGNRTGTSTTLSGTLTAKGL